MTSDRSANLPSLVSNTLRQLDWRFGAPASAVVVILLAVSVWVATEPEFKTLSNPAAGAAAVVFLIASGRALFMPAAALVGVIGALLVGYDVFASMLLAAAILGTAIYGVCRLVASRA